MIYYNCKERRAKMKKTESENRKTASEIIAREESKFTAFLIVKFVVVYVVLFVSGIWINHYFGMLTLVIYDKYSCVRKPLTTPVVRG